MVVIGFAAGYDDGPERGVIIRLNRERSTRIGCIYHHPFGIIETAIELYTPPGHWALICEYPRKVDPQPVLGLCPVHSRLDHAKRLRKVRIVGFRILKAVKSVQDSHSHDKENRDQRDSMQPKENHRVAQGAHRQPLPTPRTQLCRRGDGLRAERTDSAAFGVHSLRLSLCLL